MSELRQRQPRYESKVLRDLCKEADHCYLRLAASAGASCYPGPYTPCHSNMLADGKGIGVKTDDHRTVPGCHWCHSLLDGGNRHTREEKQEAFDRAYREWDRDRWVLGLVKVA